MTRKTGKTILKARQQMRAAKVAKAKRELSEAGVTTSLEKPSAKTIKEKEVELRKMYLEMFPKKSETSEGQATEETAKTEEATEETTESEKTGETDTQ